MNFIGRQLDKVKRHRGIALISLAGPFLSGVGYVWFLAYLRGMGPTLVMHFNNLDGINQYGTFGNLAWAGGFGVLLTLVNLALALELADRDSVLARVIAGANVFIGTLLFMGFTAIIGVN